MPCATYPVQGPPPYPCGPPLQDTLPSIGIGKTAQSLQLSGQTYAVRLTEQRFGAGLPLGGAFDARDGLEVVRSRGAAPCQAFAVPHELDAEQ